MHVDLFRRSSFRGNRLSPVSAAGKARNPGDQAARQPARPGAGLFARRRRGLHGDRRRSGEGRRTDHPRQSGRRGLQRHRRARPWQYRPAGLQAGDGRQGGAVQEIRRHRRVRHRDRRRHHRQGGRGGGGAGADLRRHQSRGHQGPGMFRDRGPAQGADENPGIPRRPAWHRHHRRRRDQECAAAQRQEARRRQDRRLRRGRRGDRLPQSAGVDGRAAQEHLGLRYRRRRP